MRSGRALSSADPLTRRLTTFVLAGFYLLQATWLLHAGVDYVFPRLQQLEAAPDACCARTCGCPEEAQRRKTCCCSKEASGPSAPAPRPLSSIEEARCRGVEAAMNQAFTQPVVCGVAWVSLPVRSDSFVPIAIRWLRLPPFPLALEKVPIAQA
jgi:hypothetical protein